MNKWKNKMVHINEYGNKNETYMKILLNQDKVEAIITPTGSCLKIDGAPLDKDLTELVLEEIEETIADSPESCQLSFDKLRQALGYLPPTPLNSSSTQERLPKDLVQKIKTAFREWKGKPNADQCWLMKQYGLEYISPTGGNYGRIREISNPHNGVPVANTPRSYFASGRAVARDLVRIVFPSMPEYLEGTA